MINIKDKKNCCGCSACVQRCPKQCIEMYEDNEGFLYPKVDASKCVDCRLCEKVCPVINQNNPREPLAVYAAKNPDDAVRMQSSSGGIFTMLAERVIDEGGVVFGACWDEEWNVKHDYADTREGLAKFRSSKYLQSVIGNSYQEAECFLKEGRRVMFTGTPCQIAGLKKYLCKEYKSLLTVDVICHGVPSPGVFRTYLRDEIHRMTARQGSGKNSVLLPCIPLVTESDGMDCKGLKINSITFRDKRNGWKKFGFALSLSEATAEGENSVLLSYSPLNKNLFMRGFLSDIYLRPSCYNCPVKNLKSESDITIGDWWGIDSIMPDLDDDSGISAIVINTEKGRAKLERLKTHFYPLPFEKLIKHNPALVKSSSMPDKRIDFFLADGRTFEEKIKKIIGTSPKWRVFAGRVARLLLLKSLRNI